MKWHAYALAFLGAQFAFVTSLAMAFGYYQPPPFVKYFEPTVCLISIAAGSMALWRLRTRPASPFAYLKAQDWTELHGFAFAMILAASTLRAQESKESHIYEMRTYYPHPGKMPELEPLIEQAKQANLTGLDLQFTWPFSAEFVSKIRGAGLKLIAWTVDDAEVASRLVELGVDGITTNRPAWLREQLKQ